MGQKANEWGNAIAITYEGGGGGGVATALPRLFAFSFFLFFTHVSLCSSASLSFGTLSFCDSRRFSPSTVSSRGSESSKRVPVVEWMYRFMGGSGGTASQDDAPRLVQLRALGCWSIR